MKKLVILLLIAAPFLVIACKEKAKDRSAYTIDETKTESSSSGGASSYDPTRGEGKFDATNVDVSSFDPAKADKGKAISGTKCLSCHKTTGEKLVGPGWKGVTIRRTPHWIMNFVTNPDPMIDKDPEVQAQFEICLVRMPNQNIAENEAREILEYMRQIDGAK